MLKVVQWLPALVGRSSPLLQCVFLFFFYCVVCLFVNCELKKLCIIVWSAGTFNHTPSNEVWIEEEEKKGQKIFCQHWDSNPQPLVMLLTKGCRLSLPVIVVLKSQLSSKIPNPQIVRYYGSVWTHKAQTLLARVDCYHRSSFKTPLQSLQLQPSIVEVFKLKKTQK